MTRSLERVKVLLVENVHRTAHEVLGGSDLDVTAIAHAPKEDELIARLPGFQVLGIRSKTRVTEKVLASAPDLLTVGCFCIGTNQVDLKVAHGKGVPVFNAPFSNTRSVAELIIAEIVMLARQLGDRSREVHDGRWRKVSSGCYEIRGKTLGIVGYGHIGTQVGVLAEAFGMRAIYYDVATKLPIGNVRAMDSLADLLAAADFVTLHVPLTAATERMIGEAELRKMKKGSFLLNASRGPVVQIGPLADALRSKHVAGAAVDVYPDEPESNADDFASELRGLPNVILTPHIGGSTEEAQAAIGREVGTALSKFVLSGTSTGAVNFPQVELPQPPAVGKGTHRILNVHRNVPGVLRDINRIVSDRSANIRAQVLATDPEVGYLIMDVDDDVSADIPAEMAGLQTNIRTRVIT